MAKIIMTRSSIVRARQYCEDSKKQILSNNNIMKEGIDKLFSSVSDPSIKKYIELNDVLSEALKKFTTKIDSIDEYCVKVLAWYDKYSNL